MDTRDWVLYLMGAGWGASIVVGADLYGWPLSLVIASLGFIYGVSKKPKTNL